ATQLVRNGASVSLSLPLTTRKQPDSPEPADHTMTLMPDTDLGLGSVRFAKDYIGADYHNEGHSHIDAFSHVIYDGVLYDGEPDAAITSSGAHVGTIGLLRDGLIGRGVLLDVPRTLGVPWIEPGEDIFPDDLEATERAQGIEIGIGDILLIRTGIV